MVSELSRCQMRWKTFLISFRFPNHAISFLKFSRGNFLESRLSKIDYILKSRFAPLKKKKMSDPDLRIEEEKSDENGSHLL